MKVRRVVILSALLIAAVLLLAPAAFAWTQNHARTGDRLTTQQWILKKATQVAAADGVSWVDLAAALPVVGAPDTRLHDYRYHTYDRWGRKSGQAQLRTQMYFELARKALGEGDVAEASRLIALLTHYYSDACDPLHTDASRGERRRVHRRFERPVAGLLASAKRNPVRRIARHAEVADIGDSIAAFTARSARQAHRDYRRAVKAVRRHGFNRTAARVAGRAVRRAVAGVAAMIEAATRNDGVTPLAARPAPATSPTTLSLHKDVTVTSEDALFHPGAFANDGDRDSWWSAGSADYPQSWAVDLGQRTELGSVTIAWYKAKTQSYQYKIDLSEDGSTWWTMLDRSDRTQRGVSSDDLYGEKARYVRVVIVGCGSSGKSTPSSGGSAAISEVTVYAPATEDPVAPTPTPTPTPTVSPTPTIKPTPTVTPTASPTPTTQPTSPAGAIVVAGSSAGAIDAAISQARSGDTIYFPAGTYAHGTSLTVPDGLSLKGAGIAKTHLAFQLVFGSNQTIADMLVGKSPYSALTSRSGTTARNTEFVRVRFRGGGPMPGVTYSPSGTTYLAYYPTVQLGTKGSNRSASHITFRDCELERSAGDYVSPYVRANVLSAWEDNRAGYSHLEYVSFVGCHFGVKNPEGKYGAITANIELKTNSYGSGSFDHNWNGWLLKDCTFERSGDFNLDFTDAARSYLKARGMTESGTTGGTPNWMLVPTQYHAGMAAGGSVTIDGCEIHGCGYSSPDWWYLMCFENPLRWTVTNVTAYAGNRTRSNLVSSSEACGPMRSTSLGDLSAAIAGYDAAGMTTAYGNRYLTGWGGYTASPYDP